jgi:hypothetical protein
VQRHVNAIHSGKRPPQIDRNQSEITFL